MVGLQDDQELDEIQITDDEDEEYAYHQLACQFGLTLGGAHRYVVNCRAPLEW